MIQHAICIAEPGTCIESRVSYRDFGDTNYPNIYLTPHSMVAMNKRILMCVTQLYACLMLKGMHPIGSAHKS